MHDFIRHECLNLIIARKQFVKDSKERIKAERQKLREKKENQSSSKPEPEQQQIVEEEKKDRETGITDKVMRVEAAAGDSDRNSAAKQKFLYIDPSAEEAMAIPSGVV